MYDRAWGSSLCSWTALLTRSRDVWRIISCGRGSRVNNVRHACQAEPSARSWFRYSMAWPRSAWLEVGFEAILIAFSTYTELAKGPRKSYICLGSESSTHLVLHFHHRLRCGRTWGLFQKQYIREVDICKSSRDSGAGGGGGWVLCYRIIGQKMRIMGAFGR